MIDASREYSSDISQLGTLIQTYRARATPSGIALFIIMIFLFLVIIASIIGFSITSFPFFHEGTFLIILPLVLPLLACVYVVYVLRENDLTVTPISRKLIVSLYTNGLIYREGRKQHIVPWQRISSIQRQVGKVWNTMRSFYVLHLTNGSKLVLKMSITDVQELGNAIEQNITQHYLPLLLADYHAGKPITFPGITLTQRHLHNSDEKLPWSQIGKLTINSERVSIQEKETIRDWFSAPISQIPNLCVLQALLATLKQEREHFSTSNS